MRRSMGGFSLLEVVVAFAILALTLGMFWQVLSMSAKRATVVEETHRAVMLAESKVSELGATGLAVRSLESGEFDGTYRWERRVERMNEGNRSEKLPSLRIPYRVVVEVQWGAREVRADGEDVKPRSVVLTTVRLGSGE
jgi:general secretion pathway protein I